MKQLFIKNLLGKSFLCRYTVLSQAGLRHASSEVHKPIKKILVANRGKEYTFCCKVLID